MIKSSTFKRLSFVIAFLSWCLLLVISLIEQYQHSFQITSRYVPVVVKGLLLNLFILGTYAFSYLKSRDHEDTDIHELIWKVFLTGLVSTLFSGLVSMLLATVYIPKSFQIVALTFGFYVEFGLITIFLITALVIWKRIILYERGTFAFYSVLGFEYALFSTTVVHFFEPHLIPINPNAAIIFFFIWVVIISVNLKWVPHLVFNQKLISIFQFTVILFCLAYFLASITSYFDNDLLVLEDFSSSIFYSALFVFVVTYAGASLLVTIFNLPTSSVFEKKIKELAAFQELSDAIYEGENKEQVYEKLLESSHTTVAADASWIYTNADQKFILAEITLEKAQETKTYIYQAGYDDRMTKKIGPRNFFKRSDYEYNSIVAFPLYSGEQHVGTLVLLKKIYNAFDNTMVSMVKTFVAQAGIAIQNFSLISEAVENERYKGELEIAKKVQARLLPTRAQANGQILLYAKSESAKEVGGDYYDFYQIDPNRYAVIIADVAGKGIPAAFNMAQLKGIFQALVQMHLPPDLFLIKANAALANCLEKSAFVTAIYLQIDANEQKVCFTRAGHCPLLLYRAATQEVLRLETQGLGLGIIRDEKYAQYVRLKEFEYEKGDLLVLYTDGIIEAASPERELYGYERLEEFVRNNHQLTLTRFSDTLMEEIYAFTQTDSVDDDFTILLVKF